MVGKNQRTNIHHAVTASIFFLFFLFLANVSYGSGSLSIQAELWEYASLCDFQDSSNWPTKEIYKKDTSFTSTGCKDLETKYGHPPAIIVKLKNTGNSEIEIPLKGMKSINVVTKESTTAPIAIRNRQRSPFGSGFMKSFDTEFTGEKVIVLQESQVVDLIFIFSEAAIGDTLKIKDVGTAKIISSKEPSTSPLPPFKSPLAGNNEVRIKNPNNFKVKVGLRSGTSGKDFDVAANGIASVFVPDGSYQIYFVYSTDPRALFQGDNFKLSNNGVEIQIVKVVGGNYGIKRVK